MMNNPYTPAVPGDSRPLVEHTTGRNGPDLTDAERLERIEEAIVEIGLLLSQHSGAVAMRLPAISAITKDHAERLGHFRKLRERDATKARLHELDVALKP